MLNKCDFIGRLGQDPEVRFSQQGTAFANISIACSEKWKDKQTGEQKEHTEWVKCVASGRLAEICGEYLRKGSLVYVSGKVRTRKWQDQSGQDRYSTEFNINEMKMLDSQQQSSGNQQTQQQGGWGQPQQPQIAQQQTQQRQPQRQQSQQQYNEPQQDWDSEIPFAPIALQYRNLLNTI